MRWFSIQFTDFRNYISEYLKILYFSTRISLWHFYFCGRSHDSQLGVTVALHHCWRSLSPPWLPPSHHDFWRQRWRHWVGLTFGPFIIHSLVKDQLLPPRFRSTRTSYSSFGYHPSLPIPSFPLSSNPSNHANSPHAMVLVHVMVQIRFLVLAHAM